MASTAVSPSTAGKNAMIDALVDLLDLGSSDATGDLVIKDGTGATLATLTFSNPAFGSASNGSASASAITSATASGTGTATNFQARNRDNTVVFSGSVGTLGEALNLSSVSITTGDSVAVTAFTVAI